MTPSSSKARTVVLLGSRGAGKTALAAMFGAGKFVGEDDNDNDEDEAQSPGSQSGYDTDDSIADCHCPCVYRTNLIVDLAPTSVRIVDIPEGDPKLVQVLVDAVGFILVYSVTDKKSFQELERYRERVIEAQRGDENVAIMIIGSKADLENERCVPSESGRKLAAEWNCPFRELSAKDEVSVDAAFLQFVRTMRQSFSATEIKHEVIIVANALIQIRNAYNIFKKDKEMSLSDCRAIFREVSNPFPDTRLNQLLSKVMHTAANSASASSTIAPSASNSNQQHSSSNSRERRASLRSFGGESDNHSITHSHSPRSSLAGSWPVKGVSVSFNMFLQLFCLWVENGIMTSTVTIERSFHVPRSLLKNASSSSSSPGGSSTVGLNWIADIINSAAVGGGGSGGGGSGSSGHGVVSDSTTAVLDKGLIDEAFRYIRKLFNLFDQNKDNQIDSAELKSALTMLTGGEPADSDVQTVLQELDVAGTGTLSFEEFMFIFYLLSVDDEEEKDGKEKVKEKEKNGPPSYPENSELRIAVRSGYLSKRGSVLGMWKKKFCVLSRTRFFVFSSVGQSKPLMNIDLGGDCYVDADESAGILIINSCGEILQFKTTEPEEAMDWLRDIRSNLLSFQS